MGAWGYVLFNKALCFANKISVHEADYTSVEDAQRAKTLSTNSSSNTVLLNDGAKE